MKINPMCDLLVGNRPENDSDTQYYECEDCYRYEICKNYGCVEMCSLKEIKEATPNILEPSYDLLKQEGYFEMSMISEQVKYLREFDCFGTVKQAMLEAADTIEALSARLQVANGSEWISCEDSKNIPYNKQLVWITIEYKDGDIERIEGIFIDGELCYMDGISVSTIAKAWMPRYVPEPYRPQPQRS